MNRSKNTLKMILFCIVIVLIASNLADAVEEFNKSEMLQQSLKYPPPGIGPTDDPPLGPIIAVAEFEPATGVLIRYPLWIPVELVAEMAEDVEVMTVVSNEQTMQEALQDYIRAGVDTSNCTFVFSFRLIWPHTRDYGPWYIFDGNDEQGLIDNEYFMYPPFSITTNWVPRIVGNYQGIPVYKTGIRNEGGNYMTDGMGKSIVTNWLNACNPNTPTEELIEIYENYLGIDTFILTGAPLGGVHIDMWAKYLDPGRIIVIDPVNPNAELEEWVDYFETLMSSYGRPYEVLRVPGVGYSNALILNNKVLVPQFNWATDSIALEAYQDAMPGYEVLGFYYPTFSDGDALHCRTHEMADRYMLRIVHVPVHDCENDGSDYYLEADVHAYSNEPLIGPPVIMWKTEGGTYSPVVMTFVGDDIYYGEIPQQPDGTDTYYYLEAEDGSGRVENHPYIGPGNPHHFYMGPDSEAPVVEFEPPARVLASSWPLALTTYVLDNRWISSVTLEHSINGIPLDDTDMPLEEPYAVYYTGTPTSTVQPGDIIEVRVKAIDTSVNQNTTYSLYYTITVEGVSDVIAAQPSYGVSPNPFNPTTVLSYQLQAASRVSLGIYDISGRLIESPLQNAWRNAGVHEVTFDGSNLASGVYIYRLEAGEFNASGKMVLMK